MRNHRWQATTTIASAGGSGMRLDSNTQGGSTGRRPRSQPSRRSFRRDVVALHRQIFRHNERQIAESITGYSPAFKRYERRYLRGVQRFRRRATMDEVVAKARNADVVYFGDYHTLPQAQRAFLRLLRRLPAKRRVTLALEFVQGRHQAALDRYMADEIDEATFLNAIDHSNHWIFGNWSPFREIFAIAKRRNYRVVGIDSKGLSRGPGSPLEKRDRYAAKRIANALLEEPERQVFVLVGELHTAPDHLPRQVRALVESDLGHLRELIVHQNVEAIYRRLEERGLQHDVHAVQISSHIYCLLNTPPIVCQQSFLNWLQADDEGDPLEAPEDNVREYVRLIAAFFELPLGDALDRLSVTTVSDLGFLEKLEKSGDFSRRDMRILRRQIVASQSYYIPRAHLIYLGTLSASHASEEATHFLRHVCSGSDQDPPLRLDAFYSRCIEEAVGFLGSKLINHRRRAWGPRELERMARSRHQTDDERRYARLCLKHLRMEAGLKVRGLGNVYDSDLESFNAVTHMLGYLLGDKLYYGLVSGHIEKQRIRELFFQRFDEDGSAFLTYLYWSDQTRDVRLPQRY